MSLRKVGSGGQTISHKKSLEETKEKTGNPGPITYKTGGGSTQQGGGVKKTGGPVKQKSSGGSTQQGGGLKKTGGPVQQKSGGSPQQGGPVQTKQSPPATKGSAQ
jgi:hypothetical protein